MSGKADLTKAQRELLESIKEGPRFVVDYYKPAQKVVEKGFAVWSGTWMDRLTLTDAGRAALNQEP